MIYLMYVACGYLLLTSVILLRNRLNFTSLSNAEPFRFVDDSRKVSICVPARNEERNIEQCIRSALNQTYPNLEVLVLDDHSTDRTSPILQELKKNHPNGDKLILLKGKPKPDDWLGKPWACQQLGEAAEGHILIFADADTWFEKDTVARVVRTMGRDVVDMLTVWPRQKLKSFWEKMLIPLVYYALFSLLPVHYVYRAPRWMPSFLRQKFGPLFVAACGQFMVFKEKTYRAIGGHQSVKQKVVDDVKLAKKIKSAGFKMRMYYGSDSVACRMYRSHKEIKNGFRKNFLAGFGYNLFLFLLMGLLHLAVYVLPTFTFIWSLANLNYSLVAWSLLPILLMLFHRFLTARWFGWNPAWGLLHPISVLWFEWLGFLTVRDYLTNKHTTWKSREI
ncbi:MAG: glycosyltransferase family 2 protein [Balneolaceae bacterium]|nr:glycosyltransferase family 2 protein [Balneolaceae bacterium]